MQIKRSQAEIDRVRNRVAEYMDSGASAYTGLAYEDGVEAAFAWLFGETDDPVFEDQGEDDDEEGEDTDPDPDMEESALGEDD